MTHRSPLPHTLLLLTLLSATEVRSQESMTVVGRVGELAGHMFVPSSFMQDPFVRTYLRTALGFGMTPGIDISPPPTIGGRPVPGLDANLLYAVFDVEYQHSVRDWLALRGRLSVVGRLANETPALVAQGVTLYSGFELGWLVRIAQSERGTLSGSLQVKNAAATDIYLQRFLEGIADSGEVLPGNKLVATTPILRGGIGLHGSYVLSALTGVTVDAGVDYGEAARREKEEQWFYNLGFAFDFNLRSDGGIPLGFVVGARIGSAPQGAAPEDNRSAQNFFGRIAYTGAEDFALGLDVGYQLTPVRALEEKQGFISAVVDVRLYF